MLLVIRGTDNYNEWVDTEGESTDGVISSFYATGILGCVFFILFFMPSQLSRGSLMCQLGVKQYFRHRDAGQHILPRVVQFGCHHRIVCCALEF
jgi:hypothetical protein